MTPPPPRRPQTFLNAVTQAVQTMQARIDFSKLRLKPGARAPELWVQEADAPQAQVYPLLGDRYTLGRSSKSCDIVVRNPVVSQVHLSLERDRRRRTPFVIRDEQSTNGIYRGKRRIASKVVRHGDIFTLGPPELAQAVRIQYVDPPPWYKRAIHYGLYGVSGLSAIVAVLLLLEWGKISVYPLPTTVQGPVVVYSRDQIPLRPPRNDSHREMEKLSGYSPYLPMAVIASEDTRFYWHLGVDPIGILRAMVTNITTKELREGASTLTQQVARSLFRDYVGTEDSAGRKLREALVALKLEMLYGKDTILLAYLNRVYLGSGNYGFEDAAQYYFGKSAKDLDISEAATLAGILPAPNTFNPIRNYNAAIEYRDRVINRMAEMGMITQEEAQRARRSRVEINPKARQELESTIAPYFYDYVFDELQQLLGEQLAREGNFIVETSLDPKFQKQAEAALDNTVASTGASYNFSQGAIVTLNFKTGEILALVGGVNYKQSQFNRATQAQRQPGSTFKMFTYTAALEQGVSPNATYSCASMTWEGQFFEGCGSGTVDLTTGVARSINIVALRVAREIGLDRVIDMAHRLGIRSKLNPVPGLTLGQSEVTVLELTGAYGTLANSGVRQTPHAISRILDSGDCADPQKPSTCRVIFRQDNQAGPPVLQPEIANTMTNLLQGVIRGGTGRSAYLGLGEAGKTGTTNDNVDLWFVGYIPNLSLVTGVWLGNDNNSPTSGSSAQAAQLWGDYMGRATR
ncbi:penicillin-binding protein [Leptolyngbya sp. 'hensonii']|uniref:PBP1A family penicillin-binding protein n=1 Tax=Leptolyngbya sp. 'hensonii' TaxID=1922337 RepID=UPI0009502680|nr:PBP1A family penicillin-binding protein [Leptolyngbya sp. 'hensonii']OLP16333.1 penicillin-binding protein [Leptolyngbya sp. 'hensonii']